MKIFIGTHENCGIVFSLANAFRELGHEVVSWVKSRDRFFPQAAYDHDFSYLTNPSNGTERIIEKIPIVNKVYRRVKNLSNDNIYKKLFWQLPEFDLYIYTWSTVIADLSDLDILKSKGKKIIFLFIGSEARYAPAFNQQFKNTPIPWKWYQLKEDINKKLYFLRKIEQNVEHIFSLPDQAGLQVRPYWHMYMPFELKQYNFNYPDNSVPKIIHAPSNPLLKGTNRIEAVLDELKNEGCQFEYMRIENVPNHIVRQKLSDADIAVDQIYAHGPGIFGLEAMASGCALAVRYLKDYESVFKPPVCYIDSHVMKENLRKLINDSTYRKDLALKGRHFVENYNEPVSIAKRIMKILNGEKFDHEYQPSFFINDFVLANDQIVNSNIKQLNKEIIEKFYKHKVNLDNLKERGLI